MWQTFAARMVNVVSSLTDCARSGLACAEALIAASTTFANLDAYMQAGLEANRDTFNRARDEAHMALVKARP